MAAINDVLTQITAPKAPATTTPVLPGLIYSGGSSSFNESGIPATTTTTPASTIPASPSASQTLMSTVQPNTGTTTLNLNELDRRTVDQPKETVAGQVKSIIDENSPLQQQAEARSLQQMNRRGLVNSSMAVTAGQSALYDAALPIAQADAGIYGKASDYNTALTNQGRMYNADALNKTSSQQMAINADKESQAATLSQTMTLAQIQDATDRYKADKAAGTSASETAQKNRTQLVNNVLMTTELSPDRKAALLVQMGEPGLASAIYVVGSTAVDLTATPTGGLFGTSPAGLSYWDQVAADMSLPGSGFSAGGE